MKQMEALIEKEEEPNADGLQVPPSASPASLLLLLLLLLLLFLMLLLFFSHLALLVLFIAVAAVVVHSLCSWIDPSAVAFCVPERSFVLCRRSFFQARASDHSGQSLSFHCL